MNFGQFRIGANEPGFSPDIARSEGTVEEVLVKGQAASAGSVVIAEVIVLPGVRNELVVKDGRVTDDGPFDLLDAGFSKGGLPL